MMHEEEDAITRLADRAKEAHARRVVTWFLVTTFFLHVAYRTLSLRSLLFAVIGMFVISLTVGVAFYLLTWVMGKAFARFAPHGPLTDAIVVNVGCLVSFIEVGATIAVTVYTFRWIVLPARAVTSN
jgi:Zn-dependent protease with chaperone function